MMRKPLLFTTLLALATLGHLPAAQASVVRPAPNFPVAPGKTLKSFKGQPVVIVVARTPRSGDFRKQVKRLEKEYDRFAAQGTVFVAVFTESDGSEIRSKIPFAVIPYGASLAAELGVSGPFGLLVVGRDGNIDLLTAKVSGAYRVRDAILNNYAAQEASRRL